MGDAFAVYDSLGATVKGDYAFLKSSSLKALSLDQFSAFEMFVRRVHSPGENIDVYLSDLRRLLGLIGGEEDILKCAFVSGLAGSVKLQLKADSKLETMTLAERARVAGRARVVDHKSDCYERMVAAASKTTSRTVSPKKNSYKRGELGHFARSCPTSKARRCCFLCGREGHFVAQCPEKGSGSKNE